MSSRILTNEEQQFVAQLSDKELALHTLAIEKLGSSYFVWKSHAFNEWKAKKTSCTKEQLNKK